MAEVPINDPKHWHERAEEAHTVAYELTDPDSKRWMLRVAELYEELARRAEKNLLVVTAEWPLRLFEPHCALERCTRVLNIVGVALRSHEHAPRATSK